MVQKPVDREYLLRQFKNFDSKIIEGKLSEVRENITELQNAQDIAEITSAEMPNSHEGRLLINGINGVSEQFTTSGKNLIPYPFKETTHTDNGITWTDNGDGTVTANGTATDRSVFIMVFRGEGTPIPAGDYVLTGCPSGGSASTYRVALNHIEEGLTAGVDLAYDYGSGKKVSLDHDCNYGVFIRIEPNVTVSNLVFKPMLYNENLITYPYREITHTENGIAWADNGDGTVTANGTATNASSMIIASAADKTFKLPAGKYIISGCPSGGSGSTYRIWANRYVGDTLIGFGSDFGSGLEIELEEEMYIGFGCQVYKGATVSDVTFTPCIKPLYSVEFEPYTGGISSPNPDFPQEIKSAVFSEIKTYGKNLLQYPYTLSAPYTYNGVTWTDNDGIISASGTASGTGAGGNSPCTVYQNKTSIEPLQKGQEYILSCGLDNSSHYMRFAEYYADGTYKVTYQSNNGEVKFSLSDNAVGIWVITQWTEGVTAENVMYKPMIRRADIVDDTYEPYKESVINLSESIELNRIEVSADDDYTYEKDGKYYIADTIEKIDGEYKKVQRIGKRVNDGTTIKASYYATTSTVLREPLVQLNLPSTGVKTFTKNVPYIIADRIQSDTVKRANVAFLFYHTTEKKMIPVVLLDTSTGITSLDSANEWLKSNPITTYYPLADVVVTSLPKEDQIALNSLDTFNTVTYLEFDSDVYPVLDGGYGTNTVGSLTICNHAAVINTKAYVESLVNGLIYGES